MSSKEDDEVLQDFLVEAGEILENLSEQLVDLEQRPDDTQLLNAIFRSFHTVKGSAGFLHLTPMVEFCHITENLFDILRTGKRRVTPDLMDVVLQALDTLNNQYYEVSQGREPGPADPILWAALEQMIAGEDEDTEVAPIDSTDSISDEEFEALLDQMYGPGKGPSSQGTAGAPVPEETAEGGDISDKQLDELLDQLRGAQPDKPAAQPAAIPSATPIESAPSREHATVAKASTVRVDTRRLDDIMNMVGELVLVRNRLVRLSETSEDSDLVQAVANLDTVTADLQTSVIHTRMQPIKKVFGRFPRVVRDLARSLNKEVSLAMFGGDTGLDKNLVEALADPLVHLVRNAVDHGIELPHIREAHGKPREGRVVLSAEQEGDHILLTIADDGAGMDPKKLRRIAVEKGLYDNESVQRLSDSEALSLIFAPGFSTKTEVSDLSGRGVGMDVVKTKITQLSGSVEVSSTLGEGTRLSIKVPLTLAIMPTLMIKIGDRTFALPLANVNEIFYMDLSQCHVVDGQKCVTIREQAIPLFFLQQWLLPGAEPVNDQGECHVVLVSVGIHQVGFAVDQLVGQEDVVVKPLGKVLQHTPGMAGATITGDGGIALILDVPGLLQRYAAGSRTFAIYQE